MFKRKRWLSSEIKLLIANYQTNSIYELMGLLPARSQEGINNKIKRLKVNGKISETKSKEAITRAYSQRYERSSE